MQDHHECVCEDGLCGRRQVATYRNSMYLGVAKSGSTSIIASIFRANKKQGDRYFFLPKKDIISDKRYKFSFVRNPYTRLVSCWQGWTKREDSPLFNNPLLTYNMSFSDFVYAVSKIPNDESNRHYVSQATILDNGKLVDFIGKLENIESDWKTIQSKTGLGILKQQAKGKYTNHMSFYNDELKRIVYDRYIDDFKVFKYEK